MVDLLVFFYQNYLKNIYCLKTYLIHSLYLLYIIKKIDFYLNIKILLINKMNNYINSIEIYLDDVNKDKPAFIAEIIIEETAKNKPIVNIEATTLDMKILRNRIDSVSIMQYYKDLKNNRIKTNENITYVETEKDINDIINKSNHDKPWNKADNYTKLKKIEAFVKKLLDNKKIDSYTNVENELKLMLLEKKISKKNITFDDDNNIVKMGDYIL